ncbi:MAG: F0F1-type ATP synthase assembly protein I [Arenicella sp.]|jgi:F0F1-type ATP synthase assembly protein I
MIATILLAAFIGDWIDGKMGNEKPIMTMVLMLLGVTSSIILLIRGVQNTQKNEDGIKKNDSNN